MRGNQFRGVIFFDSGTMASHVLACEKNIVFHPRVTVTRSSPKEPLSAIRYRLGSTRTVSVLCFGSKDASTQSGTS